MITHSYQISLSGEDGYLWSGQVYPRGRDAGPDGGGAVQPQAQQDEVPHY